VLVRAAWRGTRIILRQVSPEANGVFDLIISLYRSCQGDWEQLATDADVGLEELHKFLNYAALFLSNIGNYFVSALSTLRDFCTDTNCSSRAPGTKSSYRKFRRKHSSD
jgi:dipeptidyl-peptidase-3